LFLLGEHPGRAGLAEIAERLRIPKSSAHALLHTLVTEDLLARHDDGEFSLSPRWVSVLIGILDGLDVREAARPVMGQLSRNLAATTNLGVLHGQNVVYIEQFRDRTHPIQLATYVGFTVPAHATALGKALVASLPEKQREAWLDGQEYRPITDRTVRSRAEMEKQIADCRDRGYAIDNQESFTGVLCVAAPIRDYTGGVVAAVSITTIRDSLLAREGVEEAGARVREAAERISRSLAWTPESSPD
jgi:DNA-binding IclR family transcriptional regulator